MVRLATESMKGSGRMLDGVEQRRGTKLEEDQLAVRRDGMASIHKGQGQAFGGGMRRNKEMRVAMARWRRFGVEPRRTTPCEWESGVRWRV